MSGSEKRTGKAVEARAQLSQEVRVRVPPVQDWHCGFTTECFINPKWKPTMTCLIL